MPKNKKPASYKSGRASGRDKKQGLDVLNMLYAIWDNVFSDISDMVFVFDENFRILKTNKAFREFVGKTEAEILGKPCYMFIQCSDKPIEECPRDGAIRLKKTVTQEVFVHELKRYFSMTISPVFDEKGNAVAFLHFLKDITKIREIEEAYRALYTFNSEILEHAPIGIIRIDKDFRIIYENKKMKEILGVPEGEESEAMGKDIRKLPSVKKAKLDNISYELEKGGEVEIEVPFVSIYGKPRILHAIAVPIMHDKIFSGAVILVEDITERKEAEQKLMESEEMFRALAEKSLVGIYLIQDNIFRYVNPKFAEIFGYGVDELIDKKGPEELVYHEDWHIVRENLRKRLSGELNAINYSFRGQRKDGSVIYVEVFGSRIIYKGKPAIIGTLIDITERIKTQKELEKAHEKLKIAYEELRTLDDMKNNILANISHELRTPITIASNAMELMREAKDEETRNKLYEIAKRAMHRENLVVEDLLEASKLRSIDEEKLKFERFDLNSLVELIVEELRYLANEKNIEIYLDLDEKLPKINGDAVKISRAVRNLLLNAIKFNKENGYIKIKTRKKGGFAEILISDSGIGIPKKDIGHRIFEPFYQVDSSIRRRYGGIGMGLFVVKKIVDAHKGRIYVESRVGEGSTFRILLPINADA